MKRYACALFDLTRMAFGEPIENTEEIRGLSPEELDSLYCLSKSHDVAHIVGEMLSRLNVPMEDALSSRFLKQQMLAVYRYERLQNAYMRVCDLFETQGIDYMPLKGAVIRPYYPDAWMRTSCDIDILIHAEDLDRAVEALATVFSLETKGEKKYHDISLFLDKNVHLELHFTIQENIPSMDAVLSRVWENSHLKEGTEHCYLQNNDFLMFHLVAHAAYHFVKGGCGIRPFMDWWLLKRALSYDETKLLQLCEEAALKDFALSMDLLSNVWLSKYPHTDLTLEMEAYIFGAGVYGTVENRVTLVREKSGSGLRYALKRIFLPYNSLKNIYPTLARFPVLYPFYTVKRWFDVLLRGRGGRAAKELRQAVTPTNERDARVIGMCRSLGLIE